MMTYRSFTLLISVLCGMLFAISVQAMPVSSVPYFFRANIMNPDGSTADRLLIGTIVNSLQGTSAVAVQGATTVVLQNTGYPNELSANLPYNSAQLGPWTITAINGLDTTTNTTNDLFGVQALPFVSNISISGDLLIPTMTWELPVTSVPYTRIRVRVVDFVGGALVFTSDPLPNNATTYTFPDGVLQQDRDYLVRVMLEEIRGSNLVNRSDRRVYYSTYSTPLTISRPDVYYFRRTIRQAGADDRDQILLDLISVTPSAGTTVTAKSLVDNNVNVPMNFAGCGIFPNEFFTIGPFPSTPNDIAIATGGFIITANNGGDQDQVTTHDIVGVQPLAFVENVNISGNPLAPTISWTLPAATAPFTKIHLRVTESDANGCIFFNFPSPDLSTTTTTYTIPAGKLKPGANYTIRIRLQDVPNGVLINSSEVRAPHSTVINSGDVTGDGNVNALDVVAVINHFLGIQNWPRADVNGDGNVNALDVVAVINTVLGL